MLLRACFEEREVLTCGTLVKVSRGELIASLNTLCMETGLSMKRARSFIKNLEKGAMIRQEKGGKWTKIIICNYDTYQNTGQEKGRKRAGKGAGRGQAEGNPYKEYNKERNIYRYSEFYDKELLLAEKDGNDQYEKILKILFGDNSLKIPLKSVLSLPTQLSFAQFKELMYYKVNHGISFNDVFVEMENWKDLTKKHKTVFGSFKTFMTNKYPALKKAP